MAETSEIPTKKEEFRLFLFVTIFLGPLIAAGTVGSYGFIIWISQIINGPPIH